MEIWHWVYWRLLVAAVPVQTNKRIVNRRVLRAHYTWQHWAQHSAQNILSYSNNTLVIISCQYYTQFTALFDDFILIVEVWLLTRYTRGKTFYTGIILMTTSQHCCWDEQWCLMRPVCLWQYNNTDQCVILACPTCRWSLSVRIEQ